MSQQITFTMRYPGPPSCADCQREGIPLCAHIGFNPESYEPLLGRLVHAPVLNPGYEHTLTGYQISDDRKTIALTVDTDLPHMMDLAQHLSTYGVPNAKAWVRAVHHETGETLEEGHYDRPLVEGMAVCIDRVPYTVAAVEHPNRNANGVAPDGDLQLARLVPVPMDDLRATT